MIRQSGDIWYCLECDTQGMGTPEYCNACGIHKSTDEVIEVDTKTCPKCKKVWPAISEQSVAIDKKGKCIGCMIRDGDKIQMDPYEFGVKKEKNNEN